MPDFREEHFQRFDALIAVLAIADGDLKRGERIGHGPLISEILTDYIRKRRQVSPPEAGRMVSAGAPE